MTLAALELRIDPLPVCRTPTRGESVLTYGFALRMPDDTVVLHDDPLLAAFATVVADVVGRDAEDEVLQSEAFDPGRTVSLRLEGVDDDGDEVVAVWDADGSFRAGVVDYRLAARIAAAQEHDLEVQALLLTESRTRRDDRRCALTMLIAPTALVSIDVTAADAVPQRRPTRPRLVLVADGRADLRWWDPSASAGPIPLADVPVSADLSAELARLGKAYAAVKPTDDDDTENPFEALENGWARDALHSRVRAVWTRARAELGRSYAVGLLAPGMSRPAWSPSEIDDEDEDEELPF